MTRVNGHSNDEHFGVEVLPESPRDGSPGPEQPSPLVPSLLAEPATRAKQRAKLPSHQNRSVILAAGAVVTALLIFAAVSIPNRHESHKMKSHGGVLADHSNVNGNEASNDKSLFPIIDSGRPGTQDDHRGFLSEQDLQRTVTHRPAKTAQTGQSNIAGTLGSIAPFGNDTWQAPPYPGSAGVSTDSEKIEQDGMAKSSVIYVQKVASKTSDTRDPGNLAADPTLGLPTGTRLRARLESVASTAVRAPVLAVIEYNYERESEIVVPAGAKAVGHIRDANRSGYVDVEFDSLVMPDGASVPITATATDLNLRPLRGKVEGKNTGKNVLVRSLSGIGQAGSMFIGQGSLNQPLSESDLIRERVSSNIGEAGDEAVSRLAVTQRIVVTVSAGIPIYIILQQAPKANQATWQSSERSATGSASTNIDQLRQLLQLQQELSQTSSNSSAQ